MKCCLWLDFATEPTDFIGIGVPARRFHPHANVQQTVISLIRTNHESGIVIPRIFVGMMDLCRGW